MSAITADNLTSIPPQKKEKDRSARAKRITRKTFVYFGMTVIALFMLLPLYYTLITSMRFKADVTLRPSVLIPEQISFFNYGEFFRMLNQYEVAIGRVMLNTLMTVGSIIILQLLFCSLSAYSLARLQYRGKEIIVKIMFASMMIPGVVSLVPSYLVIRGLGLMSSPLGVIVPASFSIYGTLFMRAFFMQTPKELAEAGRIDGAGEFRIFLTVYLRMVVPGMITLGLFTFNSHWNSFLWPSIVLRGQKQWFTIAITIREFQGVMRGDFNQGVLMAATIITVLPTITIFLVGQRFFMDNLAFSGIK